MIRYSSKYSRIVDTASAVVTENTTMIEQRGFL